MSLYIKQCRKLNTFFNKKAHKLPKQFPRKKNQNMFKTFLLKEERKTSQFQEKCLCHKLENLGILKGQRCSWQCREKIRRQNSLFILSGKYFILELTQECCEKRKVQKPTTTFCLFFRSTLLSEILEGALELIASKCFLCCEYFCWGL